MLIKTLLIKSIKIIKKSPKSWKFLIKSWKKIKQTVNLIKLLKLNKNKENKIKKVEKLDKNYDKIIKLKKNINKKYNRNKLQIYYIKKALLIIKKYKSQKISQVFYIILFIENNKYKRNLKLIKIFK